MRRVVVANVRRDVSLEFRRDENPSPKDGRSASLADATVLNAQRAPLDLENQADPLTRRTADCLARNDDA